MEPEQQAIWRDKILRGECPICGKGGFRVVARHVANHGIYQRELRDICFFTYGDSICDPATREQMSLKKKEAGFGGNFGQRRGVSRWSAAGMARMIENGHKQCAKNKGKKYMEITSELRRKLGLEPHKAPFVPLSMSPVNDG